MPEFGFVGATYTAASITQDDQDCINWYPEIDPTKQEGERGIIALLPCPGTTAPRITLSAGAEVRGFRVLPGSRVLLAVSGSVLYAISANYTATQIGVLATNSGRVYITDNGVSAYITDGVNRYTYVLATNAFAIVADGAFTGGNVCDVADNYIFYNRPGTTQFGCTNVGSTVSGALNSGQKIGSPDNVVSLIALGRDLHIIGEKTKEVWSDAGTFPFPYAIIPGTSIQHGILAQNSTALLGEGAAWLARDDRGQCIVAMTLGYQMQRISTFAMENEIQKYSVVTDAIGYSYQQAGHEFYMLTFPTADKTWCYDVATGLWHRRAWRDNLGVYHRHRSNCAALFNNEIVIGDYQNGTISAFSLSQFTDNGVTLPCVRRCRHLTSDLNKQYFHEMQIQFQPGAGLQTGQGSNPQAMLRWSDDGGFTFGNDHWRDIGKVGKYKNRARWQRMGFGYDRIYELTVTDPVYRVVVSSEMKASVGAN